MVKLNQTLPFIISTYYLTRNSFFSLNSGMNSSSSSTLSSLGPKHLPLLCFFCPLLAPSSSFMRMSLPSSCCPSPVPSSSSVGLSNSNSSLSSASSPSSASLLNSYCRIRLKVPVLVYVSVSPSLINSK